MSAQKGLGKSEFARRKVEVSSDESRTLLGGSQSALIGPKKGSFKAARGVGK